MPAPAMPAAAPAMSGHIDLEPWAAGLGGRGNVLEAAMLAGRLCARLADVAGLDEPALMAAGARGVARLDGGAVQVLLPPAI